MGYCFGNLTLNRKDVRQIAIVGLSPLVLVASGIHQLGIDTHTVGGALDATLEKMRYAKLLSNLTQVSREIAPVLHHARSTDHFQVRNFGEVSEDFVLHAVG